jgi:hypothetical protein
MPQPSPAQHAEPNAKAKTQHQAYTNAQHPSQDGPGSFGFGRGIGSRPTLDDHCVCPLHSHWVGQRQRQQPLALRNGWVAMQDGKRRAQSRTMLVVALAKSVFARAPRPPPTIFRRGRNRNPIGSSRAKSPH